MALFANSGSQHITASKNEALYENGGSTITNHVFAFICFGAGRTGRSKAGCYKGYCAIVLPVFYDGSRVDQMRRGQSVTRIRFQI